MITKRVVLATSMLVFTVVSGQAFAGTTITDRRYWPDEVRASSADLPSSAKNAFNLMTPPPAIEHEGRSYDGGPKSDY